MVPPEIVVVVEVDAHLRLRHVESAKSRHPDSVAQARTARNPRRPASETCSPSSFTRVSSP
eukprot:6090342-Pyramimonas_sp.AAC.1